MSSIPWVSIIIPCYNAQKFIGEAIQSALNQTYPNKEVIVIDDGSTDESLRVIRSFGDAVLWETGPNRGGSAARNRGIALAKGELIQFLDADDLLYPRKLEKMVPLATQKGPDHLAVCDWEVYGENGVRRSCRLHDTGEDPLLFCLRKILPVFSPLHWKISLEKNSGFREDLPCCQEFEMHLRLTSRNMRLVHLPEILLTVRRQPGSVSSDHAKILNWRRKIFRGFYLSLQTTGGLTVARRRAIARACSGDGYLLLRFGKMKQAARCFVLSAQIFRSGKFSALEKWHSHAMDTMLGLVRAGMTIQACKRWLDRYARDLMGTK